MDSGGYCMSDRRVGLRLRSWEELEAAEGGSWLVDGLLPGSGLAVLFGEPGTGKTFLALDWALTVATGANWFGHQVIRKPVVYIAGEGAAGISVRVEAWRASRGSNDMTGIKWLPESVDLRDMASVEAVD